MKAMAAKTFYDIQDSYAKKRFIIKKFKESIAVLKVGFKSGQIIQIVKYVYLFDHPLTDLFSIFG